MKGAILIVSCEKHREARLSKYRLPQPEYEGWQVFYVFANLFLDEDYQFDGDILTVRTEDSYLHLTKKIAMAFRAILETHEIEEGILRCGDDLVFNETALRTFLLSKKSDYMGFCWKENTTRPMGPRYENAYMPDYYKTHREDFDNPLQGLPPYEEVVKMDQIPWIQGASGVLTYFSKRSCKLIVREMNLIDWNIEVYDDVYGYKYIIEDIANACILSRHDIFAEEYPMWTESQELFDEGRFLALHTNDSK